MGKYMNLIFGERSIILGSETECISLYSQMTHGSGVNRRSGVRKFRRWLGIAHTSDACELSVQWRGKRKSAAPELSD